MQTHLPIILIPGLGTSPRSYCGILPALWKRGSVTIVNHSEDDSIEAMAKRILANAPPQCALIGHSMGGYIAFEMLRQAPDRVLKLALLHTSARPDHDEAKEKRNKQIEKAEKGRFAEVIEDALPAFVHPLHREDKHLQEIITAAHYDAGVEGYIRHQTAIIDEKIPAHILKTSTSPP